MPILSFSDNLLDDAYIIFQNKTNKQPPTNKSLNNFEIAHRICSFFDLRFSSSLKVLLTKLFNGQKKKKWNSCMLLG